MPCPYCFLSFDPGWLIRYISGMAIQFTCQSCHQPIEVDDEWAGQPVGCPFCSRVVTAPTVSTLPQGQSAQIPFARKCDSDAPAQPGYPAPAADQSRRGIRLGWLGIIFSSLALVLFLIASMLMVQLIFKQFGVQADPEKIQQYLMETLSNNPGSLAVPMVMMLMGFVSWLAGIGLSIASTINRAPAVKRLGIVGLCISAVMLLLVVCQ